MRHCEMSRKQKLFSQLEHSVTLYPSRIFEVLGTKEGRTGKISEECHRGIELLGKRTG